MDNVHCSYVIPSTAMARRWTWLTLITTEVDMMAAMTEIWR